MRHHHLLFLWYSSISYFTTFSFIKHIDLKNCHTFTCPRLAAQMRAVFPVRRSLRFTLTRADPSPLLSRFCSLSYAPSFRKITILFSHVKPMNNLCLCKMFMKHHFPTDIRNINYFTKRRIQHWGYQTYPKIWTQLLFKSISLEKINYS